MTILLFFAFIAGFATILAPCIWPILPIVFFSSLNGGLKKSSGFTLGIMSSFMLFTLAISTLEKIFHIDANAFRILAVCVLIILGLSMLIPSLGAVFESFISRVLGSRQNRAGQKKEGFTAGYVMGFSTGMVWTPCAGPILATIATLAATQAVNAKIVIVTAAYVFGLGVPLFFLSLTGARLFKVMHRFNKYTVRIQQAFGLVVIIAAVLIYTNYDKTLQLAILKAVPFYGNFFDRIEHNTLVDKELRALGGTKPVSGFVLAQTELSDLGPAPEFTGITHWFNSEPLTMASLRGKVVLVDFWTYTCINCVRELPHVVFWYEKYKNNDFVVVGVHAPEFAFEKNMVNVKRAIKQFGITFPVAQDNDFKTWRAFDNHYWPAVYLIDANGRLRKTHFGEGQYDETEQAIRNLLAEAGHMLEKTGQELPDQTPFYPRTPETYLGSYRIERLASPQSITGDWQIFSAPANLRQDKIAYEGQWKISGESAQASKGAVLKIHFRGEKVFLVISPGANESRIQLWLDGEPVMASRAGTDVKNSQVILDTQRLYNLIDLKGKTESHILKMKFLNEGISVFAFTFG